MELKNDVEKEEKTHRAVVTEYMEAWKAGDVDKMYDLLTPTSKKDVTLEKFKELFLDLKMRLKTFDIKDAFLKGHVLAGIKIKQRVVDDINNNEFNRVDTVWLVKERKAMTPNVHAPWGVNALTVFPFPFGPMKGRPKITAK